MAGEDEIIQKVRVQDDGAVQTLTNIDKKMQDMRTTTANLNSTVKESGGAITQMGEKMVGLGQHHMNARHAVMLFSEATGVARGGIMTMIHSMGMLGPVVGAAVGGFVLWKQHMDSVAEAAQKTAEKNKELADSFAHFSKSRTENRIEFEMGKEGAAAKKEAEEAREIIDANNKRMSEITKTGIERTPKDQSYWAQIRENMEEMRYGEAEAKRRQDSHPTKHIEPEALKGEAKKEYEKLQSENTRKQHELNLALEEEERRKKYQEALRPANEAELAADKKSAESHGLSLQADLDKIAARDMRIESQKKLAAAEGDETEKTKLRIELEKEEIEQIKRRNAEKDKEYERTIRLKNIAESPGVYATPRQKAEFSEGEKWEKEKHEAELIGGDVEAINQRHAERMKQIETEENRAINNERSAINVMQLKNAGDNYQALQDEAKNHWQTIRESHTGNAILQGLDDELYAAEKLKNKQDHDEQTLSLEAKMREETLRIRGDTFSAEKDQLDEAQHTELLAHKDQADKINALYKIKNDDLTRRRGQDFADKSQGYQNAITGATQGSMMAQIQNLTYEHNKAQSEYKREGTPEAKKLAELEDQAYKAKIHEMKIESNAKQQGHVGFMEAGGAWEAFSASLNKNPMEALHLQEEKMTNALLNKIDGDLQKNEKSSKAVAGAGAQAVAAHADALAAAMNGTASPDAAAATAAGKADSPSKKWINKDGLLWKAQEKAIKDKEKEEDDHPRYDSSGRLISGTPKPYHTTHTVDEAHGFKRMNMSDLMDAANLQETKTTNQILKEMNDKLTGKPVLVG